MIGIYKITNPEGKIYVGQSKDIEKRKHDYRLLRNKNQIKIHRSIVKYGWENHKFEIITECDQCELNDLEEFYIKELKAISRVKGLNLKTGGKNSVLSPEALNKMAKTMKNKHKYDADFRERFLKMCRDRSEKIKGVPRPKEVIDKIRNTKAKTGTLTMKKSSIEKMAETQRRKFNEDPSMRSRMIDINKLSSGNVKPVRCILTDKTWGSCKQMCEEMGLNLRYTRKQLNGSRTNFTTYEYTRK